MKSALRYTSLRLLLLVAVGGLAYAAGMRGLLLLVAAFLISGLISVFVLRDSRTAFSEGVSGYFRRLNDRIDRAGRAEDEALDLRAEPGVTPPSTSAAPRTADSPRSS